MLKENLRTIAIVVVGSFVGSFVGCVVTVNYYEGRIERALNGTLGPFSPDSLERDYQESLKRAPSAKPGPAPQQHK